MALKNKNLPSIGDGIHAARGAWQFDDTVPEVFDQHVSKSIPEYEQGHNLIVKILAPLLSQRGVCYELGCSTGVLTAKLAQVSNQERVKIIGLDTIEGMIDRARGRCATYKNVSFEIADISAYSFNSAIAIVSYYTLHFISLNLRKPVLERVFNALNPGGQLLLFEKIRFEDESHDKKITENYHEYKISQGFTQEEIIAKSAALEGVLIPQTENQNLEMLKNAGFKSSAIIFNTLCWQGYLAVK